MSEPPVTPAGDEIEVLYRRKARAEIESAEGLIPGDHVRGAGDELADVLLIKGEPGDADRESGRAFAGPDGAAADKALDALGVSAARYSVCSRPGAGSVDSRAARLRLLVEAVDPRVIVLMDRDAAADFGEAFSAAVPAPGVLARIGGRAVVVIDDFAVSLGDEGGKRRVWRQLQVLREVATCAT